MPNGGQDHKLGWRPLWAAWAALFGFLGVAFGAFAAHALAGQLSPKALGWVETASHYWLAHAPVLLGLSLLPEKAWGRGLSAAAWGFALGCLLFGGSLVAMALTGVTALAWITPLGGLLLLFGWGGLAVGALRAFR